MINDDEVKKWIAKAMAHLVSCEDKKELGEVIDYHRSKVKITCEESCWCWDLETAIIKAERDEEKRKAREKRIKKKLTQKRYTDIMNGTEKALQMDVENTVKIDFSFERDIDRTFNEALTFGGYYYEAKDKITITKTVLRKVEEL